MRRVFAIVLVLLGFAPAADALTVRDVIELARAGLGEEVLLALVEVDRSIYAIDTATLKSLKAAGVPERVIVAMVRSGREIPPPPPVEEVVEPPAAEPQVVVIDHRPEEPQVREVMVPVPVYVPVQRARPGFRHTGRVPTSDTTYSTFVPFQSGPPAFSRPEPRPEPTPVYWGFGGKLRPDAWQPDTRRGAPGPKDRQ
jgi:hypothetical protein